MFVDGVGGVGGRRQFSVICDWPFLKIVICEKAKFNYVIFNRGVHCDVCNSYLNSCDLLIFKSVN